MEERVAAAFRRAEIALKTQKTKKAKQKTTEAEKVLSESEKKLHKQVCQYIKWQYPNVLFNTDMSGIRLPVGLRKSASELRSGRGFPDVTIYEPRQMFVGLVVELKVEGTRLCKSDGSPANNHIAEQNECLNKLKDRGWQGFFCCGFDSAKETIDTYLRGE